MDNRYMKGCLASPLIRAMQIKRITTIRHHLTYVSIAVIKKTNHKGCEDVQKGTRALSLEI